MNLRNIRLCRKSRLPRSTYNVTPFIYSVQTHKQFYKLLSARVTCWESTKNCKGARSLKSQLCSGLAKEGGVWLMEESTGAPTILLLFHMSCISYILHNDFSIQSDIKQNCNLSFNLKLHSFPTFRNPASFGNLQWGGKIRFFFSLPLPLARGPQGLCRKK